MLTLTERRAVAKKLVERYRLLIEARKDAEQAIERTIFASDEKRAAMQDRRARLAAEVVSTRDAIFTIHKLCTSGA